MHHPKIRKDVRFSNQFANKAQIASIKAFSDQSVHEKEQPKISTKGPQKQEDERECFAALPCEHPPVSHLEPAEDSHWMSTEDFMDRSPSKNWTQTFDYVSHPKFIPKTLAASSQNTKDVRFSKQFANKAQIANIKAFSNQSVHEKEQTNGLNGHEGPPETRGRERMLRTICVNLYPDSDLKPRRSLKNIFGKSCWRILELMWNQAFRVSSISYLKKNTFKRKSKGARPYPKIQTDRREDCFAAKKGRGQAETEAEARAEAQAEATWSLYFSSRNNGGGAKRSLSLS